MLVRRSSIFLMLLAAGIWSAVPLLFAVGAQSGVDPFIYVGLLNGIGAVLSFVIFIWYCSVRRQWGAAGALRSYLRTRSGWVALILDGGSIAVSNAAFVFALRYNNDAAVTLIVESWPLLAAFFLTGVISRFQRLTRRQVLWSLVALVGFYFLVVARTGPFLGGFEAVPIAAAVVSGLAQAVAVAAHQRALQDLPDGFGITTNFLLQSIRMTAASVVGVLVGLFTAATYSLDGSVWLPAVGVGAAIMASAVLYALSLQASQSAAVTLMWFLTPVVSIALLASVGMADLNSNVMVGATLVIAANIFLQERLESSINVTALVVAAVAVGTVILYTRGFQVADYFNYVQIVSAFYGILQGFLLTRLWDRRMRVGLVEEKWALQGRSQLLDQRRVTPPPSISGEEAEHACRDAAEINVLRQEMRSYSEAILLTILGAASSIVLVVGRSNTFLGDVLAFLIPIAIVFLLTVTWALLQQGSFRNLAVITSDAQLADAIVSYILVVLIFAAMLTAIGVKN
jgi:drug/metabolite transporter (DMT)-like permease